MSHVTWTLLSKGQGHQAALLSTALMHKVAAAVSVGTYLAWESTAMLRLLGGEKNGGAYCVVTRTACSMFIASVTRLTLTTEAREIGFSSC